MSGTLRIVQVTDCHLAGDPEQEYRGTNPHRNLKALLQKVNTFSPDLLLATGDLSEDASPASYKALKGYFEPLGMPVLALPGNHDDAVLVAQAFPGSPVDTMAVSEHGQWQIICLNSCLEGKTEGRLSKQTLEQLSQALLREPSRPQIIALHHQPIPADSPWIDKYRLFEPEAFLKLIDQAPGVKAVVWGHVHQVCDTHKNGIVMLGSPSSAINSLPGKKKFTADALGPACRWLELGKDGAVRTGIIWAT